MKLKGAIFDFDGTLFDSMSIWQTAGSDYIRSIGLEAEENFNEIISSMSLSQSANYIKDKYKLDLTKKEIINGINKTIENFYFYEAKPKQNVKSFLETLQKRGVKMCIATATDNYLIEEALKRNKMENFFSKIFTCSSVGYGKDKPNIFEEALKFLGTNKSETLIFEDAYYSIKTAKMSEFLIASVYDKYEEKQKEIQNISDFFIADFINTDLFFESLEF
mgnify:FL=1